MTIYGMEGIMRRGPYKTRDRALRRHFRRFAYGYDALRDADRDIVWEAQHYADKTVKRRCGMNLA